MSIHRRAARRDANEDPIVAALRAKGATVVYLSAPGAPDLLVGYKGVTYLLEVKLPLGTKGGRRGGGASRPGAGGDGELTADQIAWRKEWRGRPPNTVRTPAEALLVIEPGGDS